MLMLVVQPDICDEKMELKKYCRLDCEFEVAITFIERDCEFEVVVVEGGAAVFKMSTF